ncbi:MAG: O-methyltransferase [Candidatus Methylomirabilales bacterium]
MNLLDEAVESYLQRLSDHHGAPVLSQMEALAAEQGFPIVGPVVGRLLEILTRAIGARRVFEMGSGYGYSGYWFCRGVLEGGEVVLTDTDPANAAQAEEFLGRAGLWGACRFVVGEAIDTLERAEGPFDLVYCDIDKGDYPRAFEVAREKIRVGGLYVADNALWSGRVARGDDDEWTRAIRRHNAAIYDDPQYAASIVPLRDGVIVALRIR